jgi:hypothetical protein
MQADGSAPKDGKGEIGRAMPLLEDKAVAQVTRLPLRAG